MVCSMQRGWQLYLVTCLEVRIICFGEGLPPLSPGVVYAGIDTDKHRYPIGSGRVTFGNPQSYMKAVAAAFVEIKCQKFCKRVQVRLNDFFSFIETSILSLVNKWHSLHLKKYVECLKNFSQGGSLFGGCALFIVSPQTRALLLQVSLKLAPFP